MRHAALALFLLLIATGGVLLPPAPLPAPREPVTATPAAQDGLVQAALLAGETRDSQALARCQQHFDHLARQLQRMLPPKASERDKLAAVFDFLHQEVLTGRYRKETSEVEVALTGGDYNCVSATILFVALAERVGLKPQIWHAPGHVYCRFAGPEPLEIETTCRDWLSASRQMPVRTGQRQISHGQLVGKIDYNRGILLLEQRRFGAALAALRRSVQADPGDRDARENLLAGLNNAALAECSAGHFAAAAELLAEGRAIDSQYAPLLVNDVHLHQKWVLHLCSTGEFNAAIELLEQGQARRPEVPLFSHGQQVVAQLRSRSQASH